MGKTLTFLPVYAGLSVPERKTLLGVALNIL